MHLTWVFVCNQEDAYLADTAILCMIQKKNPLILPLLLPAAATRCMWEAVAVAGGAAVLQP